MKSIWFILLGCFLGLTGCMTSNASTNKNAVWFKAWDSFRDFQFSTLPGVHMLVLLFGTIVFVHFCNGKSEGDGRERVDNCGSSSHVGY